MSNLEPVLGSDDTIRRNFSKIEDLYTTLTALTSQITTLAGAWHPIARTGAMIPAASGAGTYTLLQSPNGLIASAANYAAFGPPAGIMPIQAADVDVTGAATELRVVVVTMTNGTDDTRTVTAGLYPFTHSGGAGAAVVTLGTVVAGSTVAVDSTTNDELPTYGTEFALPADGPYILGLVLSGAGAANSIRTVEVQLQMRHTAT